MLPGFHISSPSINTITVQLQMSMRCALVANISSSTHHSFISQIYLLVVICTSAISVSNYFFFTQIIWDAWEVWDPCRSARSHSAQVMGGNRWQHRHMLVAVVVPGDVGSGGGTPCNRGFDHFLAGCRGKKEGMLSPLPVAAACARISLAHCSGEHHQMSWDRIIKSFWLGRPLKIIESNC